MGSYEYPHLEGEFWMRVVKLLASAVLIFVWMVGTFVLGLAAIVTIFPALMLLVFPEVLLLWFAPLLGLFVWGGWCDEETGSKLFGSGKWSDLYEEDLGDS